MCPGTCATWHRPPRPTHESQELGVRVIGAIAGWVWGGQRSLWGRRAYVGWVASAGRLVLVAEAELERSAATQSLQRWSHQHCHVHVVCMCLCWLACLGKIIIECLVARSATDARVLRESGAI